MAGEGNWNRAVAVTTVVALLGLAAVMILGRGGAESPADAVPTKKVTVVIADSGYHPAHVRIEAGSRVTWVNRNMSAVTAETWGVGFFDYDRSAYGVRRRFDIHTVQPGEAESILFKTPGLYRYHSSYNEEGVRGTVEVVPKDG